MVKASTSDRGAFTVVLAGRTRRAFFFSILLALLTSGVALAESTIEIQIDALLHDMFDKPEATLKVSPIVVAGDFAIADWTQGEIGGRALLRRKQGIWTLTLCTGDSIMSWEALRQAGVPQQEAIALEQDLTAAEAKLDPQQAAMFSRFEGTVTMDGTSTQEHSRLAK